MMYICEASINTSFQKKEITSGKREQSIDVFFVSFSTTSFLTSYGG